MRCFGCVVLADLGDRSRFVNRVKVGFFVQTFPVDFLYVLRWFTPRFPPAPSPPPG